MNEHLDTTIEAVLFWKGEAMSLPELSRSLRAPSGEIKRALRELQEKLTGRGITVVWNETNVSLATAPSASSVIARLQKEELSKDLGKAALETLSVVLYRSPVSRREIEDIRGVNSASILRSLLIRGLIERTISQSDERVFNYAPTLDLLALLGVESAAKLPEYELVQKEIRDFSEWEQKKEKVSAPQQDAGK